MTSSYTVIAERALDRAAVFPCTTVDKATMPREIEVLKATTTFDRSRSLSSFLIVHGCSKCALFRKKILLDCPNALVTGEPSKFSQHSKYVVVTRKQTAVILIQRAYKCGAIKHRMCATYRKIYEFTVDHAIVFHYRVAPFDSVSFSRIAAIAARHLQLCIPQL